MDQTTIVHTVFPIAKIGSLFMCGYKAGLQQGDQGQQFCHYVFKFSVRVSVEFGLRRMSQMLPNPD